MTSHERSRHAERIHLARALTWPLTLPLILLLGWQDSVFLVLCLSLYANFSGDIGAYQAARAERKNQDDA